MSGRERQREREINLIRLGERVGRSGLVLTRSEGPGTSSAGQAEFKPRISYDDERACMQVCTAMAGIIQ